MQFKIDTLSTTISWISNDVFILILCMIVFLFLLDESLDESRHIGSLELPDPEISNLKLIEDTLTLGSRTIAGRDHLIHLMQKVCHFDNVELRLN